MKKILQLSLVTLLASVLSSIAQGQTVDYSGYPPIENGYAPMFDSGYTPIFDAESYDPLRDDPGLLGRHFLEGQFVYLKSPDEIHSIDKSIKGYSTTLNVQMAWNKYLPENMGQAVYILMLSLGFGCSGDYGFGPSSIKTDLRMFTAGLSRYLYLTEDIRPFVQTGISQTITDVSLTTPLVSFSDADTDTRFIINPGVEIDITDQIAWRSVLEIDTDAAFDSSLYRSELIVWPKSWLYLRGGIVGDTEGDTIGGIIGGGIAW